MTTNLQSDEQRPVGMGPRVSENFPWETSFIFTNFSTKKYSWKYCFSRDVCVSYSCLHLSTSHHTFAAFDINLNLSLNFLTASNDTRSLLPEFTILIGQLSWQGFGIYKMLQHKVIGHPLITPTAYMFLLNSHILTQISSWQCLFHFRNAKINTHFGSLKKLIEDRKIISKAISHCHSSFWGEWSSAGELLLLRAPQVATLSPVETWL